MILQGYKLLRQIELADSKGGTLPRLDRRYAFLRRGWVVEVPNQRLPVLLRRYRVTYKGLVALVSWEAKHTPEFRKRLHHVMGRIRLEKHRVDERRRRKERPEAYREAHRRQQEKYKLKGYPASRQKWMAQNRDILREKTREWKRKNRQKLNNDLKKWRAMNRDRVREHRRRYSQKKTRQKMSARLALMTLALAGRGGG